MKQQRKSHLKEPTGRSKNQRPAQAAKEEPEMRQFRMDLKDEIKRTTEATRTTVAAQGGQRDDDDENAGKGHREVVGASKVAWRVKERRTRIQQHKQQKSRPSETLQDGLDLKDGLKRTERHKEDNNSATRKGRTTQRR